MLADYMGEEDHDAMMAFKDSYEGEGPWFKSNLLSDWFRDMHSQWWGEFKDWRADRPTWDSWSSE